MLVFGTFLHLHILVLTCIASTHLPILPFAYVQDTGDDMDMYNSPTTSNRNLLAPNQQQKRISLMLVCPPPLAVASIPF